MCSSHQCGNARAQGRGGVRGRSESLLQQLYCTVFEFQLSKNKVTRGCFAGWHLDERRLPVQIGRNSISRQRWPAASGRVSRLLAENVWLDGADARSTKFQSVGAASTSACAPLDRPRTERSPAGRGRHKAGGLPGAQDAEVAAKVEQLNGLVAALAGDGDKATQIATLTAKLNDADSATWLEGIPAAAVATARAKLADAEERQLALALPPEAPQTEVGRDARGGGLRKSKLRQSRAQ